MPRRERKDAVTLRTSQASKAVFETERGCVENQLQRSTQSGLISRNSWHLRLVGDYTAVLGVVKSTSETSGSAGVEFAVKPGASESPIPLGGSLGNAQGLSGLVVIQPHKE